MNGEPAHRTRLLDEARNTKHHAGVHRRTLLEGVAAISGWNTELVELLLDLVQADFDHRIAEIELKNAEENYRAALGLDP